MMTMHPDCGRFVLMDCKSQVMDHPSFPKLPTATWPAEKAVMPSLFRSSKPTWPFVFVVVVVVVVDVVLVVLSTSLLATGDENVYWSKFILLFPPSNDVAPKSISEGVLSIIEACHLISDSSLVY
jgi:hypothetical protein